MAGWTNLSRRHCLTAHFHHLPLPPQLSRQTVGRIITMLWLEMELLFKVGLNITGTTPQVVIRRVLMSMGTMATETMVVWVVVALAGHHVTMDMEQGMDPQVLLRRIRTAIGAMEVEVVIWIGVGRMHIVDT